MSHQYNLPRSTCNSSDVIVPNTKNSNKAIENINSYIDKCKSNEFSVDISFMNVMDACYISTMCSTYFYIKNPVGKINWIVSSSVIKDLSTRLSLGNSEYFLTK